MNDEIRENIVFFSDMFGKIKGIIYGGIVITIFITLWYYNTKDVSITQKKLREKLDILEKQVQENETNIKIIETALKSGEEDRKDIKKTVNVIKEDVTSIKISVAKISAKIGD